MHTVLARVFGKSDIALTSNECLFNLFEADIILRVYSASGGSYVINIEVDGMHHLREKKEMFCALRVFEIKRNCCLSNYNICIVGYE